MERRAGNRLVTITFYRHEEAFGNRKRRILGRKNMPLTKKGKEAARRIQDEFPNRQFTAYYSSPSRRARETAAPIAEKFGVGVIEDPLLYERAWGRFEYMRMGDLEKALAEEISQLPNRSDEEKLLDRHSNDMESGQQAADRLDTFLEKIVAETTGVVDALAFTHGGSMGYWLIKHKYKRFTKITGAASDIKNGAYFTIVTDGKNHHIVKTHNIEGMDIDIKGDAQEFHQASVALHESGQSDAALEQIQKAQERYMEANRPDLAGEAYGHEALIYRRLATDPSLDREDMQRKAEEAIEKALEIGNMNPIVHFEAGNVRRMQGNLTGAIEEYEKAIRLLTPYINSSLLSDPEIDPDGRLKRPAYLANIQFHRAWCMYIQSGDLGAKEQAKQLAQKIYEIDDASPTDKLVWVSGAYLLVAEEDKSKEFLQKAKEILDSSFDLQREKTLQQHITNQLILRRRDWRNLAKEAFGITVQDTYQWAQEKRENNQYSDAIRGYEGVYIDALETGEHMTAVLAKQMQGVTLQNQGNHKQTEACFQEALKLLRKFPNQEDQEALVNAAGLFRDFGWGKTKQGKFSAAHKYFTESRKLARQAGNFEHEGMTITRKGQTMQMKIVSTKERQLTVTDFFPSENMIRKGIHTIQKRLNTHEPSYFLAKSFAALADNLCEQFHLEEDTMRKEQLREEALRNLTAAEKIFNELQRDFTHDIKNIAETRNAFLITH